MKKALSLILAVVLVFSMATVAFAATTPQGYDCIQEGCEFWTTSYAEYREHIQKGCNRHFRPCKYGCGNGFADETVEDKAEREDHELDCWKGEITCDYCGAYYSPVREYYEVHEAPCKKAHFNIPVYKILKAIENFIRTTDWNKIINTVIDVLNKVIGFIKPVITSLVGTVAATAPAAA